MVARSESNEDAWRASSGPSELHSAVGHPWVVRTPEGDEMAASHRLATSWPLLRTYSIRQFHLRYRQSALGVAWTAVQPIALVVIYGFIFYNVLQVDSGDWPFLSVVWIGMTVWMYVQAGVQSGTVSLLNDAWLLGRVWFPREVIPLAPVVAGLVDLASAGAILVVIVSVQGATLSWPILAIPLVLAVLVLWVAAISLFAGAITVFFRDMATIVGLGLRLMFIATPVMYPASTVPPEFGFLNSANPFAVVINNLRTIILAGVWPSWRMLAIHGAIGGMLFFLGLRYIRAVERRMVDIV